MINNKEEEEDSLGTRIYNFSTILKRKLCKTYNHKIIGITLIITLMYFGAFTHLFELSYESNFKYPLEGNIVHCVHALAEQKKPHCDIINSYNYSFLLSNSKKCIQPDNSTIKLVIIVKSALDHFEKRSAIRNTWGYEERFSDVGLKRIFLLGITHNRTLLREIRNEQSEYGDIVQADFMDTYYNNTIKTIMGFKWANLYCNAKFYLFCDDDFYISVKNVLRFIRNPTEYPQYLDRSKDTEVSKYLNKITNYDLPEGVKLFSGFVYFGASPHRHQCSKWYVTLDEYPYNRWPPYISAGSYIVSREVLKLIYYGSYFTQHFRFDDIYLSIIAKKLNIEPFHHPEFFVVKKFYNKTNYKYVLSSHGFHPDELIKVWNEQKMLGNA